MKIQPVGGGGVRVVPLGRTDRHDKSW